MTNKNLPDVATETLVEKYSPLDWVGMGAIELPILLKQLDGLYRLPARVDAKVSLDKSPSRGIHMSRLYLMTQERLSKNIISLAQLGSLTQDFLQSHVGLSTQAKVSVAFELPLMRDALKSQNKAWRNYPLILSALNTQGRIQYFVEVLVTYSSTCPASAALARQLIQDNFTAHFSEKLDFKAVHDWLGSTQGIIATPHAQRSSARVKAEVAVEFDFADLIDLIEEALQTPVQGAVKREDEQEFALRNGQNLMFCEDAARKVQGALDGQADLFDYIADVSHFESLHPHNAVAQISKNKSGLSF